MDTGREVSPVRALSAGSLAVTAWGFAPVALRGITASSPTIVLYRFAAALPVLWLATRLSGGRVDRTSLRAAWWPGVFFGLSFVTSVEAFQRTSIANATLVNALAPVVVLPVAVIAFGETLQPRRLAFAAASVAGVAMVILGASDASGASLDGDVFAVLTLLLFTAHFLLVKRSRDLGVDAWSLVTSITVVGLAVTAPWSLWTSKDLDGIGGWDWVILFALILGPGLIGHGLMTWCHRHLEASVSSLLLLASPVVASIAAWAIYGQALGGWQLAGAAIVLGGLSGVVLTARGRTPVPVEPEMSEPA